MNYEKDLLYCTAVQCTSITGSSSSFINSSPQPSIIENEVVEEEVKWKIMHCGSVVVVGSG
jgi:hypothetical protein